MNEAVKKTKNTWSSAYGLAGPQTLTPKGKCTPQHNGTCDTHDVDDLKCYRLSIFTYEFERINLKSSHEFKHAVIYFGAHDLAFYSLGKLLGLC